MKILVTGAYGFLGSRIMKQSDQYIASESLRNHSEDQLKNYLRNINVDAIIHTAAISDTGYCQNHPDESYQANVVLPELLAKHFKGKLIICSSDQVYNGTVQNGPFSETALCNPVNIYGQQKLEMEQRVLKLNPDAVLLRIQWLFDMEREGLSNKPNYLTNLLKCINEHTELYACMGQYRGLCDVNELVEKMPDILKLPGGIYNAGSSTSMDMVQLSVKLVEAFGGDPARVITADPRPNLWMDCTKIRQFGICFEDTFNSLLKYKDFRNH